MWRLFGDRSQLLTQRELTGAFFCFPTGFSPGSSALSTVFASVLAVVASIFASIVPAVYAVGDDGRGAYYGCRARNGGPDDASAGGAGWSQWHINLLG